METQSDFIDVLKKRINATTGGVEYVIMIDDTQVHGVVKLGKNACEVHSETTVNSESVKDRHLYVDLENQVLFQEDADGWNEQSLSDTFDVESIAEVERFYRLMYTAHEVGMERSEGEHKVRLTYNTDSPHEDIKSELLNIFEADSTDDIVSSLSDFILSITYVPSEQEIEELICEYTTRSGETVSMSVEFTDTPDVTIPQTVKNNALNIDSLRDQLS